MVIILYNHSMKGSIKMTLNSFLQKKQLRKTLKEMRNNLDKHTCICSDFQITQTIKNWNIYQNSGVVFCFAGTEHEINTAPIIEDCLKTGRRIGVPKCTGEGLMEVCEIHSFNDLIPGKYGILEPVDTCKKISPEEIDLSLIPCLSCSRDGRRLGYGGGYYDRYLKQAAGIRAVLCRTALMCNEIPVEEHDLPMDFVICEEGIINTKNNK